MNDLISVIIPVYKVEKYLNRCVESILGQTYRNLEVILVDDGSPDRCGEMCDNFARIDNRVKVIHKKNGGLSEARNSGIEIAIGEYLTFLDSDDWVCEMYIERLYNLLKTTNSDIAVCNFIRTSEEDVTVNASSIEIYEFSNIEALEQLSGRFYIPLVVAWGKIYHKNLFEGIRYPVGKVHEDEYTAHYLLFKANKVVFTTQQMLYYWQRTDSIMGAGFNIRNKIHVAYAIKDRAEFFDEIGLNRLRDITYKKAFFTFREVFERKEDFNILSNKIEVEKDFRSLRTRLRKGSHNFIFKVVYELYYIMPCVMKIVLRLYVKHRKFIRRNSR